MHIHTKTRVLALMLALCLLLCACGGAPAAESPVDLRLIWHGNEVAPEMCFGDVTAMPDDNLLVEADGEQITDFTVTSDEPEVMRVERTADGRICLTKLRSFGGRNIGFTVTCGGEVYSFCYNDDGLPMDGTQQSEPPQTSDSSQEMPPQQAETPSPIEQRRYSDDELQAFVDADLSFGEACEKLSTVSDVVQYLYLRGYKFQSEDQGTSAQLRYDLNSGACVGGSALLSALLEGDYDDQGYVYIFYARSEHVMPYFVLDGVYFYCDLVTVFNNGNTDISNNPISYITEKPETFYDAWMEIEPHDLNDSTSDMYLAAMFTTAYCGDPARSKYMLRESADGKHTSIPLSTAEKESLQILFMREGYTFEF